MAVREAEGLRERVGEGLAAVERVRDGERDVLMETLADRETVTECEAVGRPGVKLALGVVVGRAETEAEEGLAVLEREGEGLREREGLVDALGDAEAVVEALGEVDGDGSGEPPSTSTRSMAPSPTTDSSEVKSRSKPSGDVKLKIAPVRASIGTQPLVHLPRNPDSLPTLPAQSAEPLPAPPRRSRMKRKSYGSSMSTVIAESRK